jgi:hypothetical protein
MEKHGMRPSTQHCNGEISYIDKMEREGIWDFQRFGYSFKRTGCQSTCTMSGEYRIDKQGLVIIRKNGRLGRYDSYVAIC